MVSKQAYVDVGIKELTGNSTIWFEKREMRKAMGFVGREIQKESRGYVNQPNVSQADEYPGKVSGRLSRMIKVKVSRPGLLVVVEPVRSSGSGDEESYPFFLHHGVRAKRNKGHKKHATNTAFRIQPRKNYMTDALEAKRERVRGIIFEALLRGVQVK